MTDNQQLLAAQIRNNPFMQYNHIDIASVQTDHAEVFIDIVRESTNIYGVVHGGAMFTLADCCAGLTARSTGLEYVTLNTSTSFIANVKSGRITAKGTTISRGGTICIVEVKITDEAETLLFSGTFTMYRVNRKSE